MLLENKLVNGNKVKHKLLLNIWNINKRDIGSGIIGTMAFGLGILLAALGFIDLDDDDYGVPKLVIPGTGLSRHFKYLWNFVSISRCSINC